MAANKRSTPSPHSQELPLTINRVALYARVSTLNGQNPEMQLSELREYAARRGWTVSGEYVDQGVSGSKESRPELNRLTADAHRRAFDAVLAWKIDRFGRAFRAPDVPDHRGHRGVRAVADSRASPGGSPQCASKGQEVWKATR